MGYFSSGAAAAPAADVEGGGGASTAASESETASFLPQFMRVGPLAPGAASPTAANEWTCGLSIWQRYQLFGMLLLGSIFLFLTAFFVFLPLLAFAPGKFASAFTFGSILYILAFAVLRGPRYTLVSLAARDKAPFTAAYVGSLCVSLYATLFSGSYFIILLATIIQLAALLWYAASFIPGGTAGMAAFTRMACGSVMGLARSLLPSMR